MGNGVHNDCTSIINRNDAQRYFDNVGQDAGELNAKAATDHYIDASPENIEDLIAQSRTHSDANDEPIIHLVESEEELDALLDELRPGQHAVLLFSASWCLPCQCITPRFEELAQDAAEQLLFIRIEDPDQHLMDRFSVNGYPTIVIADHDGNGYPASDDGDIFDERLLADLGAHERRGLIFRIRSLDPLYDYRWSPDNIMAAFRLSPFGFDREGDLGFGGLIGYSFRWRVEPRVQWIPYLTFDHLSPDDRLISAGTNWTYDFGDLLTWNEMGIGATGDLGLRWQDSEVSELVRLGPRVSFFSGALAAEYEFFFNRDSFTGDPIESRLVLSLDPIRAGILLFQ